MDIEAFIDSTKEAESPPANLGPALQALWWSGKGDWHKAHEIAQDAGSVEGDWVHAYLHRVEGDDGNAAYWYSRCGKPFPKVGLEEEWRATVADLITE